MSTLLIGWTTLEKEEDAAQLAAELVISGLAACAQIEGPISSVYKWEGHVENGQEYRVMVKFMARNQEALEAALLRQHPYDTPEWVVVEARSVGEGYLKWADEMSQ